MFGKLTWDLLVLLSDCRAIPSLNTDSPTSGEPGRQKTGMTFNLRHQHTSCVSSSHGTRSEGCALAWPGPINHQASRACRENHSRTFSCINMRHIHLKWKVLSGYGSAVDVNQQSVDSFTCSLAGFYPDVEKSDLFRPHSPPEIYKVPPPQPTVRLTFEELK